MTGLFFNNGHIAWPLFLEVIYLGLIWLVGDLAWRRITMPARWIGLAVITFWLIGFLVILALAP